MIVLAKKLNDLKINNKEDFLDFIKVNKNRTFKIVNMEDLKKILSDYRINQEEIHNDVIEIWDSVIDIPMLTMLPQASISLRNCIFLGRVNISGRECPISVDMEIENCIFMDELNIQGFSCTRDTKISIFHTNVSFFSMFNIKKAQVVILGCRCFFMTFHNIKGEKFDVDGNYIKYFEMANSNFDRVAFDHRQLDIKNIRKRLYKNPMNLEFKKYTNLIMDLNLFEFIPYKTSKEIKSNEVYNTMVSTLSFLKNSTTLATDRDKFTEILYYEVLIAQKKASHRVFVWFIGGFLKPFRFITLAICVLLIFAVVYSLPIFQFSISSIGNTGSLSFFDALYFSGITFTSIGYGDISPLGFTRLLAVVEGISGIAIMSSFLVALVNKYLD